MLALKFVLAFLLILLAPGYALTFLLFPGKEKIDRLERFAIAILTGVAISSLLGFGILKARFSLTPTTFIISISVVTVLFLLGGLTRLGWQNQAGLGKNFSAIKIPRISPTWIFLALVAILAMISATFILPSNPMHLTEFYVSSGWLIDSGHVKIENPLHNVPVEIHNLENRTTRYRIRALMDDALIWERSNLVVEDQATYAVAIPVATYDRSSSHLLVINLYKEASETAYATLRLSVEPDQANK